MHYHVSGVSPFNDSETMAVAKVLLAYNVIVAAVLSYLVYRYNSREKD